MMFKAIAATLALLPMSTGATYAQPSTAADNVEQHGDVAARGLATTGTSLPNGPLLDGVVDAAKRVAQTHTPEPKVLLLLGIALLLFGMRRRKHNRNPS